MKERNDRKQKPESKRKQERKCKCDNRYSKIGAIVNFFHLWKDKMRD